MVDLWEWVQMGRWGMVAQWVLMVQWTPGIPEMDPMVQWILGMDLMVEWILVNKWDQGW